jgi:predicted N-acetyltransferase YhbS
MSNKPQPDVVVRIATLEDVPECARICYAAFSKINAAHGLPCDFPNAEVPAGFLAMLFTAPDFYCVVAESEGRIVGSNCLDERSSIFGVGPITVDPSVQSAGVGRKLMQAVMDRAEDQGAAGIRLVQAAFHCRSLSLYASLGFDIREPLACLQGRTAQRSVAGCSVRPAVASDLDACKALSVAVHGFDRTGELRGAIEHGGGKVVERDGRITGYTTDLAFFGHTTAESNTDLQALIASAESFGGSGILLPSRNTAVLRWCLANGLRMVQPMTLMSKGLYNEPRGAWLASVSF